MRRAIPWPIRPRPIKPTFMKSCSCQLPQDPFDLAANVIDDGASLQMIGQYIPGIGLNLKLRRQRLLLVHFECLLDSEACGTEIAAQVVQKNRDVKMSPPFARAG